MPAPTIADVFERDHAQRSNWLDRARACASLTKPPILPPETFGDDDSVRQNYQSIGARIVSALAGKLVSTIFDGSWLRYEVDASLRREMTESEIMGAEDRLYLREIMLRSSIESASPGHRRRGSAGFHAGKRTVMERLLACGDALEYMDDSFRIRSYRNDQYVQRRDSCGDPLYHAIKEHLDPLELSGGEIEMVGLDINDLKTQEPHERSEDLFTRVSWQPLTKRWLIEQEMGGVVFRESDESVNPFFSTAFDLICPEHYGRSFTEVQLLADLHSADKLTLRILQFAALACDHKLVIDKSSSLTQDDLAKEPGAVIEGGDVQGGVCQDVGRIQATSLPDFGIAKDVLATVTERLSSAGLLASGSVRDSERTTAYEVQNTTLRELQGALGGIYASIADEQQIPLAERAEHLLSRKKGWPKLPEGVRLINVTGIAALNREADAQRSLRMLEIIGQMDDETRAVFNKRVLAQILAHDSGLDRPDLVYSEEDLRQRLEEQAARQAQLAAAGKAIDTAGNIVEANATQQN